MIPISSEWQKIIIALTIFVVGGLWYAQTHKTIIAKILRYIFYVILPLSALTIIVLGYIAKIKK